MPLTERQQMAFLLEMTAKEFREEKDKKNEARKLDEESEKTSRSAEKLKINKRNKRGETQLHLASIKGDIGAVKNLINKGADVNVTDYAGWTPLHESCSRGHYEIVKILLKAGADVNARGLEDDTPLHDASSSGHVKVVKILLKYGADALKKNDDLDTPIDVSAGPEIRDILEAYCSLTDADRENYGSNGDFLSDSELDDDLADEKVIEQNPTHVEAPGQEPSQSKVYDSDIKNEPTVEYSKESPEEDETKTMENVLEPSIDKPDLKDEIPDNFVDLEDDDEITFVPRKRRRKPSSTKRIFTDDEEDDVIMVNSQIDQAVAKISKIDDSEDDSLSPQYTEKDKHNTSDNSNIEKVEDSVDNSRVPKRGRFFKSDRHNTVLSKDGKKAPKQKKLKSISCRESIRQKKMQKLKRYKSFCFSDSSSSETHSSGKKSKKLKKKQSIAKKDKLTTSCDFDITENATNVKADTAHNLREEHTSTLNSEKPLLDSNEYTMREEYDKEEDTVQKPEENDLDLSVTDDLNDPQSCTAFSDNPYISDISDAEIDENKVPQEKLTSDMFQANIFTNVFEQATDKCNIANSYQYTKQSCDLKSVDNSNVISNIEESSHDVDCTPVRNISDNSVEKLDNISSEEDASPSNCSELDPVSLKGDLLQDNALIESFEDRPPKSDASKILLCPDRSVSEQNSSAEISQNKDRMDKPSVVSIPAFTSLQHTGVEKSYEEAVSQDSNMQDALSTSGKSGMITESSSLPINAQTVSRSNTENSSESSVHPSASTKMESDIYSDESKSNSNMGTGLEIIKLDIDNSLKQSLSPKICKEMSDCFFEPMHEAASVSKDIKPKTEQASPDDDDICCVSGNDYGIKGDSRSNANFESGYGEFETEKILQKSPAKIDDIKETPKSLSLTIPSSPSFAGCDMNKMKRQKLSSDVLNNNDIFTCSDSKSKDDSAIISSQETFVSCAMEDLPGEAAKGHTEKELAETMKNSCITSTENCLIQAMANSQEDNASLVNSENRPGECTKSASEQERLGHLRSVDKSNGTFSDGDGVSNITDDVDSTISPVDEAVMDYGKQIRERAFDSKEEKAVSHDSHATDALIDSNESINEAKELSCPRQMLDDVDLDLEKRKEQRSESIPMDISESQDTHIAGKLTVEEGMSPEPLGNAKEQLGPFHGTKLEETNLDFKDLYHPANALQSLTDQIDEANSNANTMLDKNNEDNRSISINDVGENIGRFSRTYLTELSEEDKHIVNMSMEIAENLNRVDNTDPQPDAYITSEVSRIPGINEENKDFSPEDSIHDVHPEISATLGDNIPTTLQNEASCAVFSESNNEGSATIDSESSHVIQTDKNNDRNQNLRHQLDEKSTISQPVHDSSLLPFVEQGKFCLSEMNIDTNRAVSTGRTRTVDIEPRGMTPVVVGIDLNSIEHCGLPRTDAASTNLTASAKDGITIMESEEGSRENKVLEVSDETSEGLLDKPDASELSTNSDDSKMKSKSATNNAAHLPAWRKALMRKHAILHQRLPENYNSFSLFTGNYNLRSDHYEETSNGDDDEIRDLKEEHLVELEKLHLSMEQELVRVENIVKSAHNGSSHVSCCSVVLYQNLEQYAKLNGYSRLNSPTTTDASCPDELRKSLIQEVLDKFTKHEVRMISRHKQELVCLQKQVDMNRVIQLGRKEVLRRRYLAVQNTACRSYAFAS